MLRSSFSAFDPDRTSANVTQLDFSSSKPTAGGKWLELLKEAALRVARVAGRRKRSRLLPAIRPPCEIN